MRKNQDETKRRVRHLFLKNFVFITQPRDRIRTRTTEKKEHAFEPQKPRQ